MKRKNLSSALGFVLPLVLVAVLVLGWRGPLSSIINVPCYVADNPLECVARGTAAAFKLSEELLDGFEKISLYRYK